MVRSSLTSSKVWVRRLLVIVVGLFLAASTHAQTGLASKKDCEAARKVATEALKEFGKTLDLRRVHRELYVKDASMRRSIMLAGLYEAGVDRKTAEQLNQGTLERGFLAAENLSWLSWSYGFQEGKDVPIENLVSSIRRRIWRKLNVSQRKLFQKITETSDDGRSASEKISKHDLLDWLSLSEIIAVELRRALPAELPQRFYRSVTIDCFPQPANDFLGLKDRETFYVSAVVKGIWGKYTFKMVRENGSMRIFSFTIHDGPG